MAFSQFCCCVRRYTKILVFVWGVACPFTSQAWQESEPDTNAFRSPLLQGLSDSVNESRLIEQSGTDATLLEQLRRADGILADVRAQNRYALRLMNRQARVGIAAKSPNILLITVDRLAAGDPGCCGQKMIQTPQIDGLASEGIVLQQFHSGGPGSFAARWSLLMGQMQHRLPFEPAGDYRIREGQATIADALWKSGYLTSFFGFWMNGDSPQQHGYENWSGFLSAGEAIREFPESIYVDAARVRILKNSNGGRGVPARTMLLSELRAWLLHQRQDPRQFFVHFSISAFADLDASPSTQAVSAQEYRRRVERTDRFVGQILKTLQDTGLARRTCVVLTAESGPHHRCHEAVTQLASLGGRRVSREGLCRGDLQVPCVIRWPGTVRPGSVSERDCAAWDLLPTFLDMAAARDRAVTDGVPFVETLRGKSQTMHPLMYWRSSHGGQIHQAAWKNGWKALKTGNLPGVQLFRSSDDPSESVDRSAEFPDVLAELIKR